MDDGHEQLSRWREDDEAARPGPSRPGATPEYVEACLLLVLGERPGYGYELKAELAELGVEVTDRGRLYRALRAMETAGLVSSDWDTASAGPARRTYRLTAEGHGRLRAHALGVRGQRRYLSRFLTRFERRPMSEGAVA